MQDGFAKSIAYTKADYEKLRNTYRSWWKGELGRPIAGAVLTDQPSWRKESTNPTLQFATARMRASLPSSLSMHTITSFPPSGILAKRSPS